ncbi:membrane-associated phospholipid phosphatase [Sphingobium sp. OAS761]|uniref:phosphatase PAP2 family protein n=1 Tax=Sphingobium sp. OAS761 TaxID=2817901 RepID=UPI00209E6088|nr:phosphatase PAP2 family protein [Sphingobium sp. OAS761]MCP1471353.1 membrane-associated phospholipid phosphatase [Sphingobium sp. OAS761]
MSEQRYFIIVSLALATLCCTALLYVTGLHLSISGVPLGLAASVSVGLVCASVSRPEFSEMLRRVVWLLECLAYLSIASLVGSIASYPLAALSDGWWDRQFLAADALLALDWRAYWNFSVSRPAIFRILSLAYGSFFYMPMLIVGALTLTGRLPQAYRFVSAFIIALVLTDVGMLVFPARSAAANLLPQDTPLAPLSGLLHIPVIEGLRDGSIRVIEVAQMNGLIAFPSFHAAASLLFMWGGWQVSMFRVGFLAVNGLMLASTPITGGHYFIDVLAGLAVAMVAIAMSYRVSRRRLPGSGHVVSCSA